MGEPMGVWLSLARLAAGLNVVLLAWLGLVWLRSYRQHGASHTLGLLVFGGFLLVENVLWVVLYVGYQPFFGWYEAGDVVVRGGVLSLCLLETLALVALSAITRQ